MLATVVRARTGLTGAARRSMSVLASHPYNVHDDDVLVSGVVTLHMQRERMH
jgi:hypothetical protein